MTAAGSFLMTGNQLFELVELKWNAFPVLGKILSFENPNSIQKDFVP